MSITYLLQSRATHWLTLFLTLVVSIASSTLSAHAQQAPGPSSIRLSPEDLTRGQYGAQHNFFFLAPSKTGEGYQSAGFFGQKLRPYLGSNTQALKELDHYRQQKTLYLIDRGLLIGAVGLYGSQVFSHGGEAVYFNTAQQVAAGAAVVSLVATLFINRHTNEYLQRAVDDYNTDLPTSRRGALWPRLRPAGVGLATSTSGQPLLGLRWLL